MPTPGCYIRAVETVKQHAGTDLHSTYLKWDESNIEWTLMFPLYNVTTVLHDIPVLFDGPR